MTVAQKGTLPLAGLLLVCGCASNQAEIQNWLMAYEHSNASFEYRVGIPDSLRISAPRVPEIDGETQTIQPDGKLSLRLLGEVRVDGMTPREIAAKLTELLREYYVDPKVQVRVSAYRSQKVYVFGQIGGGTGGAGAQGSARALPYTGRNSLLDTLSETGLSFIAWRSQIKVIRANPRPQERHVITVDVDKMFAQGDTSLNVLLEPSDIVYVPPTPLGWVGLRIQEVLFPLAPVASAYTFPASLMNASDAYENHD